jgi:hypothetical protein
MCRRRLWLEGTASAQGSSMPGGNSCCCAERSMPEPTPCRIWRASMRRRACCVWNPPFQRRRSRARRQRRPHRLRPFSRTTGSASRGQMVWQDGWTRIAALSTLLRPIVGACSTVRAAHERIAVRPIDPMTLRRLALGRMRYAASATGTASAASGGRQFQGSSCSSWWLLVLPETRRLSTSVR